MTDGLHVIIDPVHDLAAATAICTALSGSAPTTQRPFYVGTRVQPLPDHGARVQQEVRGVGGGRPVATLTDADGNVIGLLPPAGS